MTGHIGFTGSREGLTADQAGQLMDFLIAPGFGGLVFHHGDCVGADKIAADMARRQGYRIIGHPGPDGPNRAHFPSDEDWEPAPYLQRNRGIVDVCDYLIACPATQTEQVRSGTWATVRYARKVGRPHTVLYPNGAWITVPGAPAA